MTPTVAQTAAAVSRSCGNRNPLQSGFSFLYTMACKTFFNKEDAIHDSEARKRGLAEATVLRGFLGFGANSRIHTSKILRRSEDLPVEVEILDAADKIEAFLPELNKTIGEGLETL